MYKALQVVLERKGLIGVDQFSEHTSVYTKDKDNFVYHYFNYSIGRLKEIQGNIQHITRLRRD